VNLAAYAQYWRINLLTMIEYRANFFMWFAFTIVYHATAIGALWVTLNQFPSMNGWDFREMMFLYGLWMLGHAFHNTFFFTVGDVPVMIQEGRFDRFLVRPLDPLFQAMTVPQQIWPDELILAIGFFAVATVVAHVRVDLAFLSYVPLVVVGGALIDFGIQLSIATVAFWVIRIDSLRWVAMSLEQDFTRYPISIYSRGVRFFLAFVLPFAFNVLTAQDRRGVFAFAVGRSAHARRRHRVAFGRLRVLAHRLRSLSRDGQLIAAGAPAPLPTPAPTVTVACAKPNAPAHVLTLVRPVGAEQYLSEHHKAGVVDVKVYLSADGTVSKAVIVRSSGDPYLDGATYDAAVATTYVAEIRDCLAVSGAYIYRTRYSNAPVPPPPTAAPTSIPPPPAVPATVATAVPGRP